jgi:succinylglutamate desuccinylase
MSTGAFAPASKGRRFRRRIGHFTSGRAGPTVVVCGGLHGNEPAGALAAVRVCETMRERGPPLRGQVLFVAGNIEALDRGQRYVERDLNRVWTWDRVRTLREQNPAHDRAEDHEQRELLEILDEAAAESQGRLVLLDLHTTSSEGPPFTIMSDTLRNRRIAFALSGPVILGLEESVDGTLLEYVTEAGHTAVLVESGQHDCPESVDRHEAVIWVSLVAAGAMAARDVPDYREHQRLLHTVNGGLPRVLELRRRRGVEPGDGFRMIPGFRGFTKVQEGDVLAHDLRGEVRAEEDGYILLPLYQDQGDDGYFIARPVWRFWLTVSAVLRRLRLQWILRLMPGIERHPDHEHALLANPQLARWHVQEVLHLFGFRRRRPEGDRLVFSRRRPW